MAQSSGWSHQSSVKEMTSMGLGMTDQSRVHQHAITEKLYRRGISLAAAIRGVFRKLRLSCELSHSLVVRARKGDGMYV